MSKEQSEKAKAAWADPAKRAKRLAAIKKAAKDPKKQAKRLATFKTDAFKKKLRKARKKMWQDPTYRAKRHRAAVLAQSRPDVVASRKALTKQQWADGTRSKIEQSMRTKRLWKDPSYRKKITAVLRANCGKGPSKAWSNPETRARLIAERRARGADPKQRAANSARMKALWADPAFRARMCRARKKSYTPERFERVIATRKKNNPNFKPWNKGLTKHTDRRLMANSKRLMGHVPDFKKYRAWYHGPKGDIHMRCKWEVAYAQHLDRLGIEWKYEPKWFYIGPGNYKGETHLPDFYLIKQKKYVEIKGRYIDQDQAKIATFRAKYPKLKWEMLRAPELKVLGVIDIRGCAILDKK